MIALPRNPYTATVGKTPPVFVGRADAIADFKAALYDGPGSHERISIVTGPRGIGKTALLNEFEHIARLNSWHVISETATSGFTERIRDRAVRLLDEQSDARNAGSAESPALSTSD